eukprot:gb/GECG01008449.1/.p1 GENE.gb/GECG01008449.1/~~gb/GECG01008449.1/.p1  ORF type:complete len:694 (+),score=78.75 gb/GECG01008449.1/:1-2082(+)
MPRVDYHKIGGGLKDGIFEAAAAGDKDGLHGLLLKLMQDEEQPDRVLVNVNKLYHQAKGSYCGRVPLLAHAAYHGQVEVVHYLIYEDGADPNVKDPTEGNTPLHFAALGGMPETIKKLYDCGAELREPNNVGAWPLHSAAGADVYEEARNSERITVPTTAERRRSLEAFFQYLGMDRNKSTFKLKKVLSFQSRGDDVEGRTPLHCSAELGDEELVRYLVNGGADIHQTDALGYTPVHVAAEAGKIGAVERLLTKKTLDGLTVDGNNVLHLAAAAGELDIVKYICDNDVALLSQENPPHLVRNKEGYTPSKWVELARKGSDTPKFQKIIDFLWHVERREVTRTLASVYLRRWCLNYLPDYTSQAHQEANRTSSIDEIENLRKLNIKSVPFNLRRTKWQAFSVGTNTNKTLVLDDKGNLMLDPVKFKGVSRLMDYDEVPTEKEFELSGEYKQNLDFFRLALRSVLAPSKPLIPRLIVNASGDRSRPTGGFILSKLQPHLWGKPHRRLFWMQIGTICTRNGQAASQYLQNPYLFWNDAPFEDDQSIESNAPRKPESARGFPIKQISEIRRGNSLKHAEELEKSQRYLSIGYSTSGSSQAEKWLVLKLDTSSDREWLWGRLRRLKEAVAIFTVDKELKGLDTDTLSRILYEYVDLYRHENSVLASWRNGRLQQLPMAPITHEKASDESSVSAASAER